MTQFLACNVGLARRSLDPDCRNEIIGRLLIGQTDCVLGIAQRILQCHHHVSFLGGLILLFVFEACRQLRQTQCVHWCRVVFVFVNEAVRSFDEEILFLGGVLFVFPQVPAERSEGEEIQHDVVGGRIVTVNDDVGFKVRSCGASHGVEIGAILATGSAKDRPHHAEEAASAAASPPLAFHLLLAGVVIVAVSGFFVICWK
mmetsp:Transcript_2706/g.7500  ORF Transcript_2706/g.7500 Transcript_2706/m.7500 type:complete len:201 (-) Transcript_2706:230-832(-)